MFESLTGIGLATAAGLNAYIPLLAIGLLARFTSLITLPQGWQWLENGWVIAILVVLLAIEFVADKIPIVDHINDVVQTFIRPTAGGLAFGATSAGGDSATVSDPSNLHQWTPIIAGAVISLVVHIVKAAARPVINASTVGLGAPVASTAEDATSVVLALVAIIVPILIVLVLIALIVVIWLLIRARRQRRRRKAELRRATAVRGPTYPPPADPWA